MVGITPEEDAAQIIARAEYFTVIRTGGRGKKDRREFPTLPEAEADAEGDRRAMIYAVAGTRQAFVK